MKHSFPKLWVVLTVVFIIYSCHHIDLPGAPAKKYSNEVALAWINLQQRMIKTTPGFGPGPAGRSFAYSGLAMYESIVPGMPSYQSFLLQIAPITSPPPFDRDKKYFWPASVNASMKTILTGFFTGGSIASGISAANKFSIDSLDAVYRNKFASQAPQDELSRSSILGAGIASYVFDWSKTDGTFAVNPPYTSPMGVGLWVPTFPGFGPPINPYGGQLRSFTPNLLSSLTILPPVPYSEIPGSQFYEMNKFLYDKSLVLTTDEINIAKTWGDIPGNYNGPAHFTNVLTQLIAKERLPLDEAAVLYARHGIAIYDATIPIFKAKYQYNVMRPITYIRSKLNHPDWNTVIPTPAHPEYLSAHAVIAQACAEVLKERFGNHYSFRDHTHDDLFGTRSYSTFDEYAAESGWSRVLAGIHFQPTAEASLIVGKKVGQLVNALNFKKGKGY
ncbi:MAG TPA: vanadium-dependent haloperoxidase [Chryseolinea sp.]|nr:vanadium-dependent haloperoxidase [Chryseolinea sp.]